MFYNLGGKKSPKFLPGKTKWDPFGQDNFNREFGRNWASRANFFPKFLRSARKVLEEEVASRGVEVLLCESLEIVRGTTIFYLFFCARKKCHFKNPHHKLFIDMRMGACVRYLFIYLFSRKVSLFTGRRFLTLDSA
jgi:hypothetical protein